MDRFVRVPRFDWGYLVVLGLSLPVLWPLLEPAYLSSHDGLHHLFRLLDLDWCIRGASLYPRWLPNLGFGYGYPVLNYCAPLTYHLAELFCIFGRREPNRTRMARQRVKRREWRVCFGDWNVLAGDRGKAISV